MPLFRAAIWEILPAAEDPSTDVGKNVVIGSSSPIPGGADSINSTDLSGFSFYIDPGHGGTPPSGTAPGVLCPGEPDYSYGAESNGVREAAMALRTALSLQDLLKARGASVYLSRDTDRVVCVTQRTGGTDDNYSHTVGNNTLYDRNGGRPDNWRFISLHYNSPSTDHSEIQVIRKRYGYDPQAQELGQLYANWINRKFAASTIRVDYWINYDQYNGDPWVVANSEPAGHGLLIEHNFITYPPFRDWVSQGGAEALGDAEFRALVDFWITGYQAPHSSQDTTITNKYNDLLNNGNDPGPPFSNGNTPYVHRWGNAWTQEFGPPSTKGSILYSSSGGTAYYVADPIWSEYVQKNGPNSYGPGLPTGAEHDWFTRRGVDWQRPGNGGLYFDYPKTINFERGAITWNQYEGATFLSNCSADGVYNNNWASYWTERLTRRFVFNNDLDGARYVYPDQSVRNPNNLTRYNDNGVHPGDTATRAQSMQILMFAEGYPPYTGGDIFIDLANDWGKQWINMAASRGIVGGYADGSFKTDNTVTRGQFSKMLVNTRQWTPYQGSNQVFSDVPYGSTFYTYIMAAYYKGVISGYQDGTFRPYNNVTRAQISKMVDISYTYPNAPYSEPGGCW